MSDKILFANIKNKMENKFGKDFPEKLYLISLGLLLVFYNTTSTTFDITTVAYLSQICSLARYTLLLIIGLKALFLSDYNLKEFIIISVIGIILLVGAYLTKENALLFSMILIIGAKNCDIKKIAKVYFYTYIAIALIVFVLYFCGILPEFGMYRGDSARFAMGFNHPNLLGRLILVIAISEIIMCKDKLSKLHYISLILMALFVYLVPQCRSAFLCLSVMIIFLIINRFNKLNNKFFKTLFLSAIPILAIASLVCAILYNPNSSTWEIINTFSSSRIYYSNIAYKLFGYTSVLGQNVIPFLDNVTLIIDNCYIRLICEFGIIALYLFCYINVATIKKAFYNKRFNIAIILVIMGLFGIFELHSYVAIYNLALLALTADIN